MDSRFLPEELLLNSMPALQTAAVGGWLVRLNGGYTYRANCVCPLRWESGEGASEKIAACEELFRRRGTTAVFKVTPFLQPGLAGMLEKRGYEKLKTVFVMTSPLPGKIPEPAAAAERRAESDEEWLAASAQLLGVPKGRLRDVFRANMHSIVPAAAFVSVRLGGRVVGCGYGTAERGRVGIYGLHVAQEYRCRGIGTALLAEACRFGEQNGARAAYLIVHSGNSGAIALYGHLGFRKEYEYSFYGIPGSGGITDG